MTASVGFPAPAPVPAGSRGPAPASPAPAPDAWLAALSPEVSELVARYADPHPLGARVRALLAAEILAATARERQGDAGGPRAALTALAARLRDAGQGTVHQPGVRAVIAHLLAVPAEPAGSYPARLTGQVEALRASVEVGSRRMAALGSAKLHDGDRVLVHDYAATSTQAVLTAAAAQGKRLDVVATACRTRRAHGLRAAQEARRAGHRASVVTDAGAVWALTHTGVRLAFLGADGIRADGTFLATPGAHALCLAGQAAGVPVHVVTDLWKLLPAIGPDVTATNLETDPDGAPEAALWAQEGLGALNPLVDIVPGHLLTSFLTESGEIAPAAFGATAAATYGSGSPLLRQGGAA
jgi:translation initiation factor 2B subunit (eIF-2B alpha/beta/delta family)